MRWIDFMKQYDESITEEQGEYILMEQTAFPFSDIKITAYQIRKAIRVNKNKINTCFMCGNKIPFHHFNCKE